MNNNMNNVVTAQIEDETNGLEIGGFVDPVFCLDTLLSSDADSNGSIDREEYVTFAQDQAQPGLIDFVTEYDQLPLPFKLAFSSLACLCDNPEYGGDASDPGCCLGQSAMIRIPVAAFNTTTDALYLYTICARTDAATAIVLRSSNVPSMQPTQAPVVVITAGPTEAPSLAPTTLEPTTGPTPRPTGGPTLEPTFGPTLEPTLGPTLEPTRGPTLEPTRPPTNRPTRPPTGRPTLRPTAGPTFQPTRSPTEQPSQAPIIPGDPTRAPVTGTPSVEPTDLPTAVPTTLSPTMNPTATPSRGPTKAPTASPTSVPTKAPTAAPTLVPTSVPSFAPITPGSPTRAPVTALPTVSPTDAPSTQPVEGPPLQSLATVVYQISVPATGISLEQEEEYLADLLTAMNQLAEEVSVETFPPARRLQVTLQRLQQQQRQLAVAVDTTENPTGFGLVEEFGTF
jgi:hypothetical protein